MVTVERGTMRSWIVLQMNVDDDWHACTMRSWIAPHIIVRTCAYFLTLQASATRHPEPIFAYDSSLPRLEAVTLWTTPLARSLQFLV